MLTVVLQNFMKCLMRMFAEEDKGVVFYETVISLEWQAHTVIECVPLPWEQFEVIPGYFKVRHIPCRFLLPYANTTYLTRNPSSPPKPNGLSIRSSSTSPLAPVASGVPWCPTCPTSRSNSTTRARRGTDTLSRAVQLQTAMRRAWKRGRRVVGSSRSEWLFFYGYRKRSSQGDGQGAVDE